MLCDTDRLKLTKSVDCSNFSNCLEKVGTVAVIMQELMTCKAPHLPPHKVYAWGL